MHDFNTMAAKDLRPRLLALTSAPEWADELLARRPHDDLAMLLAASDDLVLALSEEQVDAALSGHPRIGEKAIGLDEESAARSAREQSGMSQADASLQQAMARGNIDYEERFGRIYLVAAAGRSAEDLLGYLDDRLDNDPDAELGVVRGELALITRLRLTALVQPAPRQR
ncbi:MAG: 2-oxo-4-hydroxy-4-carboxy-5-ureidoimidazoline decarboxylase [Nocardioides sp.]|nr:2-oxo-4-hydroxy-4-carboxy-5-ureidoimidazoline decarboxylase [Nocardioides sp.]